MKYVIDTDKNKVSQVKQITEGFLFYNEDGSIDVGENKKGKDLSPLWADFDAYAGRVKIYLEYVK